MFWTNVSYLIVSIAMFGLGVGGILGYFLSRKKEYFTLLSYAALLFSIFMIISLAAISYASKTDFFEQLSLTHLELLSSDSVIFLLYFSLLPAVPFFFAGIVLSSALNYPTASKREISYIYFGDLIGAAAGSFLVSLLVPALYVEGVIIFCSGVALVSSVFFKRPSRRTVGLMVIVLALLGGAFSMRDHLEPVPKKPLATYVEQGSDVLYTLWSPTSRVDVVQFPWGKIQFIVNGSYPVTVLKSHEPFSGNETDIRYFMFFEKPESVLAIGSGGGVELAMAMQAGSSDIVGAEINPVIMDMMLSVFKDVSGDIYSKPEVTYVVEDGRTYVNRCNRRFDLIENGVLGSDALILPSSIVQTFSDTYVYTVEANQDYWNHLTDRGMAVILVTSLMDDYNALDADNGVSYRLLRQFSTTREALKREGVSPEQHMMIFRHVMSSGYANLYRQTDYTFIFKNSLDEQTVHATLEQAAQAEALIRNYYVATNSAEADVFRFECVYAPFYNGIDLESYLDLVPENRDVSPTTDDHPYFYHTDKGAPSFLSSMLEGFFALTVLFLVLPVSVERRLKFESGITMPFIGYFVLLGIGYVLIQAVSIQRLSLFLGQPAYAFQVILFSMLVFSGLGSFITGRFSDERKMVKRVLALLLLVALVYVVGLSPLIYYLMPNPIPTKVVYSVLLLSPLYLLMGMPFPLGLRIVSKEVEKDVIWMYAVNGGGSVMGSIIGMILAFSFGFSYAFLAGVLIYAGAFTIVMVAFRR